MFSTVKLSKSAKKVPFSASENSLLYKGLHAYLMALVYEILTVSHLRGLSQILWRMSIIYLGFEGNQSLSLRWMALAVLILMCGNALYATAFPLNM